MGTLLPDWVVDYNDGNGEQVVVLPHAWKQETSLDYEGPVWYTRTIDVPRSGAWLLFHAVSYAAKVLLDDKEVATHEGMWDAFSVSLDRYRGKTIKVKVEVIKAGGSTYPVEKTATGLLPYLHHSFGGIWGEVEMFDGAGDPLAFLPGATPTRVEVKDHTILLDGEPFYMRGLQHQGWYPEIGHCRPSEDLIREELGSAKSLGFNTVKFSLWLPPHRYLEILEELGMVAWIQLPLVRPSPEANWDRITEELERIVRQYRHHKSVIAWSVGHDLGSDAPLEFQKRVVRLVRSLTGCPLVGDGGIGIPGADPREVGTFGNHTVSAELPVYQHLLNLLGPASVRARPTVLGEYSEIQVHRDMARLVEDHPFWASSLPELNARGVRQENDLPSVLQKSRFAHEPRASGHEELVKSSASMATFVRQRAIEDARSMAGLSGYVLSNWRDTPISTSGIFDDWGQCRIATKPLLGCNSSQALFLLPTPVNTRDSEVPLVTFLDRFNVWTGPNVWYVAVHSDKAIRAGGMWRLLRNGDVVAEGTLPQRSVSPLQAAEVGVVFADLALEGEYELRAEFGDVSASWQIHATQSGFVPSRGAAVLDAKQPGLQQLRNQANRLGIELLDEVPESGSFVYFIAAPGVYGEQTAEPRSFWKQATYQFSPEVSFGNKWPKLKAVQPNLAMTLPNADDAEVLIRRIDTVTYEETAVLIRLKNGALITTLWPWGGLPGQPIGLPYNPAGVQLLRDLLALLPSGE